MIDNILIAGFKMYLSLVMVRILSPLLFLIIEESFDRRALKKELNNIFVIGLLSITFALVMAICIVIAYSK